MKIDSLTATPQSDAIFAAHAFSPTIIKELIINGKSQSLARLLRQIDSLSRLSPSKLRDAFAICFRLMSKPGFRTEYFYKSVIVNNILLGSHANVSDAIIKEFRIGSNRADAVILNGTSSVYEIKSERDSLDKLESQIASYQRVFASINIICADKHYQTIVKRTSPAIGIITISSKSKIEVRRSSVPNLKDLRAADMLDAIRTDEAKEVLKKLGLEIPNSPNTLIRHDILKIFDGISPELLHDLLLQVLRQTRKLSVSRGTMRQIPQPLRATAFSCRFSEVQSKQLIKLLDVRYDEALEWDNYVLSVPQGQAV